MWMFLLCYCVTGDSPTVLTLEQALQQAMQAQPALQAAKQRTAAAEAQRTNAASVLYPQLAFSAQLIEGSGNATSASYLSAEDYPRIAGHSGSSGVPTGEHPDYAARTSLLVGVGGHYRVFDFGYSRGLVRSATAEQDAAASFQAQALQDVLLRVSHAYLQAVAAQQTLDVAQDTQRRAQQHHNLAAAGVQGGMRPHIDLARSDAELAAANLGVIRAQNALVIAHSALDTAIGWPPSDYTVEAPSEPETTQTSVDEIHTLALVNAPVKAVLTSDLCASYLGCSAGEEGTSPSPTWAAKSLPVAI